MPKAVYSARKARITSIFNLTGRKQVKNED